MMNFNELNEKLEQIQNCINNLDEEYNRLISADGIIVNGFIKDCNAMININNKVNIMVLKIKKEIESIKDEITTFHLQTNYGLPALHNLKETEKQLDMIMHINMISSTIGGSLL